MSEVTGVENDAPVPEFDLLRARHEEAGEAWLWHDADDERREGFGHHMAQMLHRLPRDSQTRDMQASIEQMLADLDTALTKISALQDAFEATFEPDFGGVDWRNDAAIQAFANAAMRVLYTRVLPPANPAPATEDGA